MKNNCCLYEELLKKIRMVFSFLEYQYPFCFRDTDVFVLCKFRKLWCHGVCNLNVKYWKNNISGNIKAVFFKLGTRNVHHKKCSSQKKPNTTHSVIAMEIVFAPVSFRQKPNILIIFQPFKVGQRVLFRTDMITILSYFSSFLLGIVDLNKTGPVAELLSWQQHNRCHFVSLC